MADRLLAFRIHAERPDPDLYPRLQVHHPALTGALRLIDIAEYHARAFGPGGLAGQIIEAQHDILGGHDDRFAIGGREDVIGGHHERARLQLGLDRERHMHGHLVAVKIGVKGRADQRVQLDRLALDEHRLKGLDAEPVQGRGAIEHDRMFADHLFEHIPDLGPLAFNQFLGRLDGGGQPAPLQLAEDKRLEQFQRHFLGDAALMQAQGRADHDHRTTGVIDPLAEQILPETALLALDHIGQGFQRQLAVVAGDRAPAPAIVQQGVNRFLQHALFIADDDIRRVQIQQPLQAVVSVDDPAV